MGIQMIPVYFPPEQLDLLYALLTGHPQPLPYGRLEPVIATIRQSVAAHNEKGALVGAAGLTEPD